MHTRMMSDGADGFFLDCLTDNGAAGAVLGLVAPGMLSTLIRVQTSDPVDDKLCDADLGVTALAMAVAGF